MTKYKTARQLQAAICSAFTLRVTVGASGDVSESVAQRARGTDCFKATFWGFDAAGNNIVEFKLL